MKKILLLRHALPEGTSKTGLDQDRHLNSDGIAQAQALGFYLDTENIKPDLVLCSSATRTRETAEMLGLDSTKIDYLETLYLPQKEDILNAVHDVYDDTIETILVVTHYPGVMEFAHHMSGGNTAFDRGYPECMLSIFECNADTWQDVQPKETTLKFARIF